MVQWTLESFRKRSSNIVCAMHCENSDFSWCYENTEQRREESMVHNSVTQSMNTIYIIGLAPVICACSPVTGSWKRAGNSVFELSSTKRKLCRQRPTTWTTKASKMQQHDWISIRRILYINCVCEHVTRRACCVFVRWAMKGFHGLDVRLSSRFPLSLIE